MSSQSLAAGAATPLLPVYPFNEPGRPVVLYCGPIAGLLDTDVPGVVELTCASDLNLSWEITPAPNDFPGIGGDVTATWLT